MPYIGASPSNGVRRVYTYTATASQTTFSGAGAEGTTLSYKDSNYVDVYQNGIKLGNADYTSTSGTSIVLAQGASVDDLVVVVVFDVFSVADTVSKADGGTFDGNVTMANTLGVTGATTLSSTLAVTGETTLATHLNMGDNDIIKLGAGSDLQIYHDGSNSYVNDAGTGSLIIEGANVQIQDTQQDLLAKFNNAGAVQLYHVDSGTSNVKLATSTAGVTVTGTLTATSFSGNGSGLTNISGTITTTSGTAAYYAARAFANMKGDGTVSIRFSKGVTSITDEGTGLYRVNFSPAMPASNFTCVCQGSYTNANQSIQWPFVVAVKGRQETSHNASWVRIAAGTPYQPNLHSASQYDADTVEVAIFR